MQFCPICSNSLLFNNSDNGYRFFCSTCEYYYAAKHKIKTMMQTKQTDIVLGPDAWENVDQTSGEIYIFNMILKNIFLETCPKCAHPKAYYRQMQTRSADEPSSIFYRCVVCGHQWTQI